MHLLDTKQLEIDKENRYTILGLVAVKQALQLSADSILVIDCHGDDSLPESRVRILQSIIFSRASVRGRGDLMVHRAILTFLIEVIDTHEMSRV